MSKRPQALGGYEPTAQVRPTAPPMVASSAGSSAMADSRFTGVSMSGLVYQGDPTPSSSTRSWKRRRSTRRFASFMSITQGARLRHGGEGAHHPKPDVLVPLVRDVRAARG